MKYKVTLYQETYTEVIVDADSQDEAENKVLSGDYTDDQIHDVTVKDSDVIETMTEE